MKKFKCKVHIGHRSIMKGEGDVVIEISDVTSGFQICEVRMSLAEYGESVAGSGYNEGIAEIYDNYDLIGKKKEIKRVHLPKELFSDVPWNKKEDGEIIADEWLADHNEYKDGTVDWQVWDYGFRTQQNGKKHCLVMCRYVEVEDEVDKQTEE